MINYVLVGILILIIFYFVKKILHLISLKLIFKNFNHDLKLDLQKIKRDIKLNFNKEVNINEYIIRSETSFLDTLLIRPKDSIDSNKLIIYFHGNAGNINSVVHSGELKKLLHFDCSILIFDYRGFGRSTGSSDENSIIYDSQVVYEFALNYLSYEPQNIMFFGNSLGCYIASNTINQLNSLNLEVPKCLILQNPFSSVFDIAYDLYGLIAYLIPIKMDNIVNIQNIFKYNNKFKIFILHSPFDEFINIKHSRKICNKTNLNLIPISGSHNCPTFDNNTINLIKNFFNN